MRTFILLLLLMVSAMANSQSDTYKVYSLPIVTQSVNDFEQILSDEEESEIAKILGAYEQKTENRILVVTVSSIGNFGSIYDFSLQLAQRTQLGSFANGNGCMIVVSKTLRNIQIQNADGILDRLTNEETNTIIQDFMIPEFRKGNYSDGIKAGIEKIKSELE